MEKRKGRYHFLIISKKKFFSSLLPKHSPPQIFSWLRACDRMGREFTPMKFKYLALPPPSGYVWNFFFPMPSSNIFKSSKLPFNIKAFIIHKINLITIFSGDSSSGKLRLATKLRGFTLLNFEVPFTQARFAELVADHFAQVLLQMVFTRVLVFMVVLTLQCGKCYCLDKGFLKN